MILTSGKDTLNFDGNVTISIIPPRYTMHPEKIDLPPDPHVQKKNALNIFKRKTITIARKMTRRMIIKPKMYFKFECIKLNEDDAVTLRSILESTDMTILTLKRNAPTTTTKVFQVNSMTHVEMVQTVQHADGYTKPSSYCYNWEMKESGIPPKVEEEKRVPKQVENAMLEGYISMQDIEVVNNVLPKSPDLYIRKYEYIGLGVLDTTCPEIATLTPADVPNWDIDAFNSDTALNLYIADDNGDVYLGIVENTSHNDIRFDLASLKRIEDGTATTITNWNSKSMYQFQILSPHDTYQYGNFMGYIGDGAFKEGNLRSKLFSTDATIMKALRNMTNFDGQTSARQFAKGFTPPTRDFFQIVMVTKDITGKSFALTLIMGQLSLGGSENLFGEEYKSKPFEFTLAPNPLFPADAGMCLRYHQE